MKNLRRFFPGFQIPYNDQNDLGRVKGCEFFLFIFESSMRGTHFLPVFADIRSYLTIPFEDISDKIVSE